MREITIEEVKRALNETKGGKAPGMDGVRVEMLKEGGMTVLEWLVRLFNICFMLSIVPVDWVITCMVPLYKGKGDMYERSNIRFLVPGPRAFFDIRVFDPVAPSHAHQSLDAAHSKQENEKRRQYENRILQVEHASFTPLVFTIAGGMSKCTKKFFGRLGEMLAEKRLQPKSIVSSWIKCRVSFSLLRSAARCLRGTRYRKETPSNIQHIDLQQQAFVGQLRGPTNEY